MIKNITKFIDTLVSNILCLSKAKQSKAKQTNVHYVNGRRCSYLVIAPSIERRVKA